ncbi:MAG: ethanolamine ammonia-lyase reactivating factor EutA, partial [Dehalococcoidia bacterium]
MHDDPLEHGHYGEDDEIIFGSIAEDGFPINPDWIRLTSVGIDIGSSTSHLMFSKLIMRRRASEMSSDFEVVHREVIYRSPILLTPYSDTETIDTAALSSFITRAYDDARLAPEDVDTGAVICTGEAVRKHNSQAITQMLAGRGGSFVSATAGPNLEGILGAHGSGAVARSRKTGTGMNVDVGGGTAKISIVKDGDVLETMALNVGARLIAWDDKGTITRTEKAGAAIAKECGHELAVGDTITDEQKQTIAEKMADLLFEALLRQEYSPLTKDLVIAGPLTFDGSINEVSFSGGVAEYIYGYDRKDYGDFGPLLGRSIRRRVASLGVPMAGSVECIRATVIGASQYTVQVSTSTVFVSNPDLLPLLDLQVVPAYLPDDPTELSPETVHAAISRAFERLDIARQELGRPIALALIGPVVPAYEDLKVLCDGIAEALRSLPENP